MSKKSFPIKIWSGLLSDGHCQKIGGALWEFIWLIDKITKEKDGIGYILGGKPIKVDEIAKFLGRSYQVVQRHLKLLEDYGYITLKKAPYGLVITVNNSKKFESRDIKNDKASLGKNDKTGLIKINIADIPDISKIITSFIKSDNGLINNDKANKTLKDIKDINISISWYLFKKIKANNPNAKEPNLNEWGYMVDLMLRVDKREPYDIIKIIDWSQQDDFWSTNILSTLKLRKQFDQLAIKSKVLKTKETSIDEGKIKIAAEKCFYYYGGVDCEDAKYENLTTEELYPKCTYCFNNLRG